MAGQERKNTVRPRLLLAYVDSIHAARTARHLRRHGWEVHLAASGAEVYRLVRELEPRVVVLDTDLQDESGWLISAKLSLEVTAPRVILLAPESNPVERARLSQVGADSLVGRVEGIDALVERVLGDRLAQAV